MTYVQQYNLLINPIFRGRVAMALIHAAQNVTWEAPETTNHAKRLQLAKAILAAPEGSVTRFIYDVSANQAISTAGPEASLDGDIDYVVASIFDRVALNGGGGAP